MKILILGMVVAAAFVEANAGDALARDGNSVIVENGAFRLVLSVDGAATSLVVKATGEECLATGVRVPFARLRQDRPYDNEMHLLHPARPMWFNANRIVRKGDLLEIGFAHEYHVMRVGIIATDDYVAFVPTGTEYVLTDDFGDKRRTEIDGIEFLRLPVRDRAHFGACADVTAGSTSEQIEMVARAAYENNAPLSFVLSLGKLRAHPQAEAIMSVFKKYEDMKFAKSQLTRGGR